MVRNLLKEFFNSRIDIYARICPSIREIIGCCQCLSTGPDLGLSRVEGGGGGGRVFKKNLKILSIFLFLDWFSELSQSTKKTLFRQPFSAPQAKFWKNSPKKAFLGTFGKLCFRHFWKIMTKNLRFFGTHSPLKISIYWRQRRV